jgi:hypothetical protein
LRDLHSERRKADYKLRNPKAGTKAFAIYCLETAESFRLALAKCAADENLPQLKAGIEAYEAKLRRGG